MKKPLNRFSKPATKDAVKTQSGDINTVVVVCMAVVQKSEYDELGVKNITPAQVIASDGTVRLSLTPTLVVGPSKGVLEQVTQNFQKMWAKYDGMLAKALKEKEK